MVGFALIATGLWALMNRPRWLGPLTIFFVPFSSTSVFNFYTGDTPHFIPALDWFVVLWALSVLPHFLRSGRVSLPVSRGPVVGWLLAFVVVATVSLVMPVTLAGNVLIHRATLADADLTYPLYLNFSHFFLLGDLAFGALLALLVANRAGDRESMENVLRIVVWSTVFVSAWGFVEYAAYYVGAPHPYFLFNNNPTENPLNQSRVLREAVELMRITSVAAEPSVLAQVMLIPFCILAFNFLGQRTIVSRRVDRLAFVLALATLVLGTSTSAYLGLATLVVTVPVTLLIMKEIGPKPILYMGGMAATVGIAAWQIPIAREFIVNYVVTKPFSGSGLERINTVVNAWAQFRAYPVLGLGWGSVPSMDLVVYLLANSGIIGAAMFFGMIFALVLRLGGTVFHHPSRDWTMYRTAGTAVALVTLIFVSAAANWSYQYGHFWLILGLAIAAPAAALSTSTADAPASTVPA